MRRSAGLDEGLAEIQFSVVPSVLDQSLEQLEEHKTPQRTKTTAANIPQISMTWTPHARPAKVPC